MVNDSSSNEAAANVLNYNSLLLLSFVFDSLIGLSILACKFIRNISGVLF